jgi:rhodanese-related sulfurtransferase
MIRQLLQSLFRPTPNAVTATEAHSAVRHGPAVLLDVREPQEWQAGHAPQANHIPLGRLESRLAELPRDRQVITVCRSGRRSALAAQQLVAHGYQAVNLTGGMTAWAAAGLPVITGKGRRPGRVV